MIAFHFLQGYAMTQNRLRNLLIFLALFSLCCASASAQANAQLPELHSKRLLNDLQVLVATTPYLGDKMTIGLVVRYGAAYDPADKGGMANLVARMLMKASVERTAKDIQTELTYLEATMDVQCDWDGFRIYLRGKSAAIERALLLFYQVIGEAQFNEADFNAEKKSILASLQKPLDPRKKIHEQFNNALFSGTNQGRPLEGTPKSLAAITVGDVRFFYRKYFNPGQSSLIVVGDLSASDVIQRTSRIWGVWVRGEEVPFTFRQPAKPAGRQIYLDDDPASPAAQFIVGNFFPSREDPEYSSALVAAQILQERLTKLLPTSLLTVGNEGRRAFSPFFIQGQAAADQAVEQIRKIEDAVEELKANAASKEELENTRKQLIEGFSRELSSTDGLCKKLVESELYHLGVNYLTGFPDQIRRCDAEAVMRAAKDNLFPEGEALLIRGPAETLKRELSPLGTLQKIAN
jgi:zinc protease